MNNDQYLQAYLLSICAISITAQTIPRFTATAVPLTAFSNLAKFQLPRYQIYNLPSAVPITTQIDVLYQAQSQLPHNLLYTVLNISIPL